MRNWKQRFVVYHDCCWQSLFIRFLWHSNVAYQNVFLWNFNAFLHMTKTFPVEAFRRLVCSVRLIVDVALCSDSRLCGSLTWEVQIHLELNQVQVSVRPVKIIVSFYQFLLFSVHNFCLSLCSWMICRIGRYLCFS